MDSRNLVPTNWFKKRDLSFRRDNSSLWRNIGRDIERVLENFSEDSANYEDFLPNFFKGEMNTNVKIMPRVDVSETEKEYLIEADLPGVKESDIDVSISEDKMLIIKGKRESKREEKERNYYMIERSYGSFERKIELLNNCDVNKIDASFKDGILNVKIPKKKIEAEAIKKIKLTNSQ